MAQPDNSKLVSEYFSLSAVQFDSLYSEEAVSPFMRRVNKLFRSDIYERYRLTMENVIRNKYSSLLDVGCGSGRYLEAFAEAGIERLVGLDISDKMLELAKQRLGERPNVELVNGDFLEYEPGAQFDCIVSMGFFDYIKDPVHVLKRMSEMSAKSIIVTFPSVSFYRTPIRKVRYYFKNCPVYFYTENDIREICEAVGIKDYEIIKIKGAGMDYWVSMTK